MKLIPAILALVATYEASAFCVSPSLNNAANYKQHYDISSIQQQQQSYHVTQQRQPLYMSITDTDTDDLISEVKSMRVAAIKQELESYGISTKTFLEKSELVDALVQARKEGKTPIASSNTSASTTSTTPSSTTTATTTQAPMSNEDRQAKLQSEIEKCKATKVGDLKSELESYGISTKSYFEKSEFVQAVAKARVDGVTKKSKKKKRRTVDGDGDDDEVEEVKAKVEVITSDSVGPKTKKSRDASQEQQSSGSPFGGGAGGGSPFGGMGGSGGLEDILKGMGGMGGAGGSSPFGGAAGGANPFGGAGGGSPFGAAAGGANPFGGMGGGGGGGGMEDAMKAAQQAMSNPKVMAVIQKAQKNPKVMQAVQECMGNPMAMSKYMSDPDVGPILKELQEAMM